MTRPRPSSLLVALALLLGLVVPPPRPAAAASPARRPGERDAPSWDQARPVPADAGPVFLIAPGAPRDPDGPDAAALAPVDQPTMTSPVTGSEFALTAPTPVTFAWTAVAGAVDYLFEYTGANRVFANPNGTAPDTVNGFGGAGGGLVGGGTSLPLVLSPGAPPGQYQVRVVARTATGAFLGRFSDAVTLLLGLEAIIPPDDRPAFTQPAGPTRLSLGDPTPVVVAWTPVPGATQYGVEHTGPGRVFANPNATAPDPVNGFGGAGGGLVVTEASVTVVVDPFTPPGAYQVRVIGLGPDGTPVSRFSDALPIVIGYWLPDTVSGTDPDLGAAIGDSITEGVLGDESGVAARPYPEGLTLLLQSQFPGFVVENVGQGGELTAGGLERLQILSGLPQPALLLVMEGTNDATFERDPDSVVANLRAMVQVAKSRHTVPILGAIIPNFRQDPEARAIVAAVNAQLPDVAAEEGVRFVDTFAALNDPGLFGPSDILHPTQAGYDRMAQAWLPAVVDALHDLRAAFGAAPVRPAAAADLAAAGRRSDRSGARRPDQPVPRPSGAGR